MRNILTIALLLALAVPLTADRTEAQGFSFIPYLGYNLDAEALFVGVGTEFDAPINAGSLALGLRPTIEYLFVDDDFLGNDASITSLQINADLIARFGAPGASLAPFAGAGLAVGITSIDIDGFDCDDIPGASCSDTDFGLNILGGAEFVGALGFGTPYVQGRLTLADGTAFSILGGLLIPLGAN